MTGYFNSFFAKKEKPSVQEEEVKENVMEEEIITKKTIEQEAKKAQFLTIGKLIGKIKRKDVKTEYSEFNALLNDLRSKQGDLNKNINKNGFTLLHMAVAYENIPAIQALIMNGAKLVSIKSYGTPLNLAASLNRADSIKSIFKASIEKDPSKREEIILSLNRARDSNDQTAFMSAVLSGNREAMEAMWTYKPLRAYKIEEKYYSAFNFAAQSRSSEAFYELFSHHRGNLNTRDDMEKNCMDYAIEFQNEGAITYLSRHPHMKRNLETLEALNYAQSLLEQKPEFTEAVANGIKEVQSELGKATTEFEKMPENQPLNIEGPLIELEKSSGFNIENTREEEGTKELETFIEDSRIPAARTETFENREARIKEREAKRDEFKAAWKAANPEAANIADKMREAKQKASEESKKGTEEQRIEETLKNQTGVTGRIEEERAKRAARLKEGSGTFDFKALAKTKGAGGVGRN